MITKTRKPIPTPGQIASALRLPGAEVTATWDPSQLSPRIRTAAKKMLQLRMTHGYGEAANVARATAQAVGVEMVSNNNRAYSIPALPPELQPRAEALINAHFTGSMLRNTAASTWRTQYAEKERKAALESVAAGHTTTVGLYYTPFPASTRELWDRTFSEIAPPSADLLARQAQAVALLDSSTPIPFRF